MVSFGLWMIAIVGYGFAGLTLLGALGGIVDFLRASGSPDGTSPDGKTMDENALIFLRGLVVGVLALVLTVTALRVLGS